MALTVAALRPPLLEAEIALAAQETAAMAAAAWFSLQGLVFPPRQLRGGRGAVAFIPLWEPPPALMEAAEAASAALEPTAVAAAVGMPLQGLLRRYQWAMAAQCVAASAGLWI